MKNNISVWAIVAFFVLAGFTKIAAPLSQEEDISLQLPSGFEANTIIPELGGNRHLVVNKNGDIYVKLERPTANLKGIVLLRDANKDGKYEVVTSFGDYGGTGIAIKD